MQWQISLPNKNICLKHSYEEKEALKIMPIKAFIKFFFLENK